MPTHYYDNCQSARDSIASMVAKLRKKADQLETLSGMMPEKLTPEQDDALRALIYEIERK